MGGATTLRRHPSVGAGTGYIKEAAGRQPFMNPVSSRFEYISAQSLGPPPRKDVLPSPQALA